MCSTKTAAVLPLTCCWCLPCIPLPSQQSPSLQDTCPCRSLLLACVLPLLLEIPKPARVPTLGLTCCWRVPRVPQTPAAPLTRHQCQHTPAGTTGGSRGYHQLKYIKIHLILICYIRATQPRHRLCVPYTRFCFKQAIGSHLASPV
jgi:hypothetical protein